MTNQNRFREMWKDASLATQFAAAGGVVLIVAALAVGSFVTHRIEASVVRNTATATALYMESFISPISQQLSRSDRLSENAHRALEEIFTDTPLGARVVSYKIWKPGGRVVEASDESVIDKVFEVDDAQAAAWNGEVSAQFEEVGDRESARESEMGLSLLEIYSPIREAWTGEVIAVAEFYEWNPQLKADLAEARRAAWALVAGVMVAIGGMLFLIVLRGSRMIEKQQAGLDAQFRDLERLSARNTDLRLKVQEAAGRSAASTEQALRRIGADLHDGPAQYLAFAALRLDDLGEKLGDDAARSELSGVKDALDQAMGEVRSISRGLALPDIADKPACEVVRMAVDAHEARTGLPVAFDCALDRMPVSGPVRICLFRFTQEALNNATRHGDGAGLSVAVGSLDTCLTLSVRDEGPGFGSDEPEAGLGLTGLRDRVESLGGHVTWRNRDGGGAEILMTLEVGETR